MEVSYKKDFDKSYMLIKNKVNQNDYKIKMVTTNCISRLIPVSVKEFNNETTLYYDISGKMAMASVFAGKKMKAEDIINYIMGIHTMLESINQYMLDSNKILMDFEHVYVKPDDGIPYFCYYPDKPESFSESLQSVFDKIIEVADHSDRETIIISYGLQQLSLGEGNITINDIVKFINDNRLTEGMDVDLKEKDYNLNEKITVGIHNKNNKQTRENYVTDKNDNYILERNTRKAKTKNGENYRGNGYKEYECSENNSLNKSIIGEEESVKLNSWQEKVKELLKPILNVKNNLLNIKGKYQTENELDSILADEEKVYGRKMKNEEEYYQEQNKECILNWKDESEEIKESDYMYSDCDATVLLKVDSMQKGVILKCSDIERAETIVPNNYPCILGKSKKSADYVIEDKSISRVHLRLYEEESGYYIEDLNSTNGTYLNEEKLSPHQITKINIGDRVKLSEIEYVVS